MDQFIGTTIGEYRILKLIGNESLAKYKQFNTRIYKAEDIISKVNYAIKIYTCPSSDIRCQNEATILEKIAHPNIISLRRHQKSSQLDFLVLEYLEKGDLFEFIAKTGHFEEDICRFYFKQLVLALEHIHQKGFAHRNLKLESILFDRKFNLKITNCAHAQLVNKYRDGKLRTRVGTINYSAPELLFGALYVGEQVDVFALGVIIFVMLKGSPPFLQASQEDKLYNLILMGNYQQFWEIHQQEFSFDFRELFISMIHPNPDKRPTLESIKISKWYNGVTRAQQDVFEIMKTREQKI